MKSLLWLSCKRVQSFRLTNKTFVTASKVRTMAGQPKIKAAEVVEQESYVVPGKIKITEHIFKVPLDYNDPNSEPLRLFARSARNHLSPVEPESTAADDSEKAKDKKSKEQLPWLIYLNGGPGMHCSAPPDYPFTKSFLEKGYQVLMLDQRGTGLSSPLASSSLPILAGDKGDERKQVEFTKLLRADNIVRDCEAVRQALTADYPAEKQKWSVIGQSFGGFCITTYLSFYPEGLREAFVVAGLPPLVDQPDPVYKALIRRVAGRNEAYYSKFPADVARVKKIVSYLKENKPQVPSGGHLTPRRFLQYGMNFGFHGGLDKIHQLVRKMCNDLELFGFLTFKTLSSLESFDVAMIYTILHEAIYCQGKASNWSAERVVKQEPLFDFESALNSETRPVYFTGEMIFPFMLDDYVEMSKVKNVANMLAAETAWPALYDRKQLAKTEVPVYAAVYMDDMYVDFNFAMETAAAIKGCKTYISNQYYHNAVSAHSKEIIDALWNLRCDSID